MILLDRRPLSVAESLNDPKDKNHSFAVLYNDTIKYLQEHYKTGYIRFIRPGFPKHSKGVDSSGREVPKMAEPTPPMRIPLQANVAVDNTGKHVWMCCLDMPTILPNQLWDMGRRRAISIKSDILVNINEEPDLAFFLYKISKFVQRGLLQVFDPIADDIKLGIEEREKVEREYAVWHLITEDDKLKTMARAYGVAGVDTKQPNSIRKELTAILERNDIARKSNPAVKGTKEFLEEMKVSDSVLLRAFIQKCVDDKKLDLKSDGRWRIGEKVVCQVPASDLKRTKEYLCNFLMAGNNFDKLQEFAKDLINKEYLDAVTDKKEWQWLAKIAGDNPAFKKLEEVKATVTNYFCPLG
jgi:hypothetical protein